MDFANEDERRAVAIANLRGTPPPQGFVGGEPHEVARPDREAVELWLIANDVPELGGIANPDYLARIAERAANVPGIGGNFGS